MKIQLHKIADRAEIYRVELPNGELYSVRLFLNNDAGASFSISCSSEAAAMEAAAHWMALRSAASETITMEDFDLGESA